MDFGHIEIIEIISSRWINLTLDTRAHISQIFRFTDTAVWKTFIVEVNVLLPGSRVYLVILKPHQISHKLQQSWPGTRDLGPDPQMEIKIARATKKSIQHSFIKLLNLVASNGAQSYNQKIFNKTPIYFITSIKIKPNWFQYAYKKLH